ncbi:hypothetical protein OIN60_03745 [Paenibacillus sp. P96]|uniref:YvrJ family protein n=1 Tax=Paenibacillus zeirhizosphaerae TaxID=2987519 RepID=A0ABT9FML2_9BACL|nr:hypothetical protein [Paenibacillus sp. P96]MDP4095904.1 hypothetical protein [Paenibacillus sp. P96]
MNWSMESVAAFFTEAGFPAALCLILLRYVLLTIGGRLDRLDASVKQLTRAVKNAEQEQKQGKSGRTRARKV